jgi:branched-chain amino acid transport system permease protein
MTAVLAPTARRPGGARRWLVGAGWLALALLPFLGLPPFVISSATQVLIYAMVAMSLDLLLGYTGLTSLGHAGFFGAGAYAAGLCALRFSAELPLTMLAALAVALACGLLVGALTVRAQGMQFLMLTLAFSQMLFAIAFKWTWLTGGANGLAGIPRPSLLGLSLADARAYYLATLAACALTALVLRTVVRSPFGQALVGIRENEARMQALGYPTWRYKWAAFGLAAALAGLAGAFLAGFNGFVAPSDLDWTTSGLLLIMAVLGGAGTLVGPALGAAIVLLLQTWLGSLPGLGERWPMVMGLVFMAFVIAGRGGAGGVPRRPVAWGAVVGLARRLSGR